MMTPFSIHAWPQHDHDCNNSTTTHNALPQQKQNYNTKFSNSSQRGQGKRLIWVRDKNAFNRYNIHPGSRFRLRGRHINIKRCSWHQHVNFCMAATNRWHPLQYHHFDWLWRAPQWTNLHIHRQARWHPIHLGRISQFTSNVRSSFVWKVWLYKCGAVSAGRTTQPKWISHIIFILQHCQFQ